MGTEPFLWEFALDPVDAQVAREWGQSTPPVPENEKLRARIRELEAENARILRQLEFDEVIEMPELPPIQQAERRNSRVIYMAILHVIVVVLIWIILTQCGCTESKA